MTSTSVKESAVKVKLGTKSLSNPEEVPFFLVRKHNHQVNTD